MSNPWPAGAATGVGSLPGTDPDDAAATVVGELPDLPYLPELPARGAGADLIGRSAALLVDLPVEIVASGWRISAHAGRDLRRARDFLAWDLDALESHTVGYAGALKLQAAGPWTLAAALELPNGHKVLSDAGAVRDLAASLAEGLRVHLAAVTTRIPGVRPVLQLDEPSVRAVLAGAIRTPSGFDTIAPAEPVVVEQVLASVLRAAPDGARAVHCCDRAVPIEVFQAAGADAISIDVSLLEPSMYDALGTAIDAGLNLWAGVLPGTDAPIDQVRAREAIAGLWSRLGFPLADLAAGVVPTPACGLAGATPAYARQVTQVLRDVGSWLRDQQ